MKKIFFGCLLIAAILFNISLIAAKQPIPEPVVGYLFDMTDAQVKQAVLAGAQNSIDEFLDQKYKLKPTKYTSKVGLEIRINTPYTDIVRDANYSWTTFAKKDNKIFEAGLKTEIEHANEVLFRDKRSEFLDFTVSYTGNDLNLAKDIRVNMKQKKKIMPRYAYGVLSSYQSKYNKVLNRTDFTLTYNLSDFKLDQKIKIDVYEGKKATCQYQIDLRNYR